MSVLDQSAATPKEVICRNCPHSTPRRDTSTIFCKVREHIIPAGAPCCGFSLIPGKTSPGLNSRGLKWAQNTSETSRGGV
jgi:hypothetical protein